MSFPARRVNPRRSTRARISPASFRSIASGLIRISDRSTAIERTSLLGASPAPWRSHLERRELDRHGFDGCLAVRADLPERLERRLAVDAGLLQLGRADGTHEELVRDFRAAHGAKEIAAREPFLHRLDLELALSHVLQILGWAEQHVDERADVGRNQTEDDRHRDQHRILDAALCILVDPVPDREPEDDQEEEQQVPDDRPRAGGEEVMDTAEGACNDHRRILPIRYPARNPSPTIA